MRRVTLDTDDGRIVVDARDGGSMVTVHRNGAGTTVLFLDGPASNILASALSTSSTVINDGDPVR